MMGDVNSRGSRFETPKAPTSTALGVMPSALMSTSPGCRRAPPGPKSKVEVSGFFRMNIVLPMSGVHEQQPKVIDVSLWFVKRDAGSHVRRNGKALEQAHIRLEA